MRVTDLEKFALEQIWWPYSSISAFAQEKRFERLPISLEGTALLLENGGHWSSAVCDRLRAIGVTFPDYIKHPLVDAVKKLTTPTREGGRDD